METVGLQSLLEIQRKKPAPVSARSTARSLDGLASRNEDKQARSKASFSHVWSGLPEKLLPTYRVSLPTLNNLPKEVPRNSALGISF